MADVKTNTDKLKDTGKHGLEALGAVGDVFRDFLTGSKDKATGAAGGVLGFIKNVGNKAFAIANGTVDIAFKTVTKFPKLTAVAAVIGGAVAVKKWMDRRDTSKELEAQRTANELMETKLTNDAVEAQMKSGKPVFDNEVAGNAAAKVAAGRAAQAQMANAR